MPHTRPQYNVLRRCGPFGTVTMALEDDARTSASEDDDVEVLEETDAEELSAERRAAICIAVLGRTFYRK